MARHFNSVFGQRMRFDIGNHTATTSSDMTWMCVFQRTDDTTFDVFLNMVSSDGTDRWWIQLNDDDRLAITGNGMSGRNSTFTVRQSDGWVLLAITKAAGTSTPRFHKYSYATDTWDHNNAGGTQAPGTAAGAGGWIDTGVFGGFNSPDGYFAVMATFTGAMSDATLEAGLAHDLHRWWMYDPTALWLFNQETVEQPVVDYSGNGCDQISIVGTSVALISAPISYAQPLPQMRMLSADTVDLGLTTETDTAQTITAVGRRTLTLTTETDAALPMSAMTSHRVALGLATETDFARPLGRHLGLAEEVDEAFEVTSYGTFGPATEVDAALPIRVGKGAALGLATETDSVSAMTFGQVQPAFRVQIDWEGDNDWSADYNDVTVLTLDSGGVQCEYGRDQQRALSPTAAGRASLAIDNRSRVFSPENLDSPLAGNLGPARPIRVMANYDGESYTLFHGVTDDFEVQPAVRKGVSQVGLTALDALGVLRGANVTTQLWSGLRTDQALSVILDHLEWPSMELNSNPYFDDNVTGWNPTPTCTISHSTTEVHPNGTGSMKMDPVSNPGSCGAGSTLFDVTPTHEYNGSLWAYAPNGHSSVQVLVNWYTAGNVFIKSSSGRETAIAPGTWTLIRDTFNPPSNAARAAVWAFMTQSPPSSQSYYFWNVRLFDAHDDPYRQLDVGASTMAWWWAEAEDAFEATEKLVRAEGPPAFLHAGPNGEVVFRSRHHRLFDEQSTIAQTTFHPTGDNSYMELVYDHGWKDVVNSVSIKVEELGPSLEVEDLWEDESFRSIAANETLHIRIALDNPVIYPTLSYATQTGSATNVSIDRLSGQTILIGITAGGSGAGISHLILRGQAVSARRSIDVLREDEASIRKYKKRSLGHDVPWAGVHDAEAIGDLILGQRSERLPIVTITMAGGPELPTTEGLTQQFSRDLSDRVHVLEEETCLDHDFFIETISHSIGEAGKYAQTQFGMEKAAVLANNVFRFNDEDNGFDNGVFATVGLDDPTAIFVFDDPDRGFNDGVFAT